jgi:MFS family permease
METGEKAARIGPMTALRVRDFRLYWIGLATQIGGQHMFQFTLGWLAFEITGSMAQLALIHLAAFIPQFTLTLLGGVLADRIDPRRLIQTAQSIFAVGVLSVGLLALTGQAEVWHLAAGSFLMGLSNSLDEPSRAAFFPRLLPRSVLRSAVPLISMAFGGSRIIAPSIAGWLIAAAGAPVTFLIAAVMISSMVAVLFLVRAGEGPAPSHGSLIDNFSDSIRYIRANEAFSRVLVAALLNAACAMGYAFMLPVFAKDILHVDSVGLGILTSAGGVGSLCGLLSYPWLQARATPRNVMVYALTVFNLALIGVAFSTSFALTCLLLAAVGICHSYFMTSCQVILQTLVDDNYRGRVMGVFTQVWSLMMLSGFLLNFFGSVSSPAIALAGGASIVLAYIWLSLARSSALRLVSLAPRTT